VGGIAGFCPEAKMRRRKKHVKSSKSAIGSSESS